MDDQHLRRLRFGVGLRRLRGERGLSLRALAARTGFSPSFISQVEAESVSPSIASLEKIANALGVTLGQFFSALEPPAATIVRRAERVVYESVWSLSSVEILTVAAVGRKLSAFHIVVEPGGKSGSRPEASATDLFILVQSGLLALTTAGDSATLEAGDTAYLTAGIPFAWENRGAEHVSLLIVEATGGVPAFASLLKPVAGDVADNS
jgi:transcriptional regulator with XRE-family HTH domain